jgi:hypothetical protein
MSRSTTRNALLLALAVLPTSLLAQGLTIHSVNDVRFQGALGAIASMAAKFSGTNMHDMPTTMYVSGHKLRTESGNTATIIDADAGRITNIDNKQKTYSSMTFDEMAEIMRRAQQSAKENNARSTSGPKQQSKDSKPEGEMKFKYKVETDRPGQREKIAGYDADRMFLTITIEGEATPEGGQTEQVGSLVFLLDQWMSKDAPQTQAMAEFQRAYAAKAGQAFRSQTQAVQAAFTADPRMKGGFDAAAKEMAKIQGTALRSVVYVSLVPPGMQFDRSLALNDAATAEKSDKATPEEKPKGGFGGLMGKLKAAADEANKQQQQGSSKSSAPPKQGTLLTMKDEVQSITTGAVPADMFAPPAGYREIKPQSGSN